MNRPTTIPSIVVLSLVLSACASEQVVQTATPAASVLAAPVPTDIGGAVDLAKTQRSAGDLDGATATLSQLVLVAPDDPRVLGEYGKILLDRGATTDALAFLQRAIELNPGEWSFYSAQGVAFAQSGDFRSAQMAFGRALMLKPNDPIVLNNFALAHLQAGNLDQAEALLLRATMAGASFPKVAQNLALVRQMRGESRSEALAGAMQTQNPQERPAAADDGSIEAQETATEMAEAPIPMPESIAPVSDRSEKVEETVEEVAAIADEPIIENEMIEAIELEALKAVQDSEQEIVAPTETPAVEGEAAETVALEAEEPVSAAPVWDIWIPSSGPIFLQVGAFASEENAVRMVEKLGTLEPQIVSADAGERTIHRVIVGPYAGRDETHKRLGALKEFGIDDVQVLTRLPGKAQERDEIADEFPSGAAPDDVASEKSSMPEGSTSLSYVDSL